MAELVELFTGLAELALCGDQWEGHVDWDGAVEGVSFGPQPCLAGLDGELLWAADAPPTLISIKQAARVLNLGRSTVYELIAAGQLEVVHIGSSARIPTDAITALINRLRADQTVPAGS